MNDIERYEIQSRWHGELFEDRPWHVLSQFKTKAEAVEAFYKMKIIPDKYAFPDPANRDFRIMKYTEKVIHFKEGKKDWVADLNEEERARKERAQKEAEEEYNRWWSDRAGN